MPTYEYRCTECGHEFDIVQKFSDDALEHCPQCEGRLRKVFNAVGVVFKGSGFYRNDARDADAKKGSGSSGGEKSGEKSEKSGEKSGEKSADTGSGKGSDKGTGSNTSTTKDSTSGKGAGSSSAPSGSSSGGAAKASSGS